MARAQDMNSANSQFYIMFVPRMSMDRNYTVFGRVVSGMSYVDAIERGEPPSAPSRIIRASLGSDNLPPMTAEQLQAEGARLAAAAAARAPTTRPPAAGPGRAAAALDARARAGPRPRRAAAAARAPDRGVRVDLFDFALPTDRIALRPAAPRDSARLLQVAGGGALSDHVVRDLPALLRRGDMLVFNDTRVIPAQLEGVRGAARIGATLHKREGPRAWRAFVRNAKRLREGESVDFGAGVRAVASARGEDGSFLLTFAGEEPVELLLERAGRMPLPPYIAGRRAADARDRDDYQTMFARAEGAVAAPTAALHFTPALMAALAGAGIGHETLTLHVGAGTFLPVKARGYGRPCHARRMGADRAEAAARLNEARAAGGRIIAVGTTSLRLLESAAGEAGRVRAFEGDTAIFITPGYCFRAVDGLLTNFHLPRSTLFMLVSALDGGGGDAGGLCACDRGGVSVLFLWRCEFVVAGVTPIMPAEPAKIGFTQRRKGAKDAKTQRVGDGGQSGDCPLSR